MESASVATMSRRVLRHNVERIVSRFYPAFLVATAISRLAIDVAAVRGARDRAPGGAVEDRTQVDKALRLRLTWPPFRSQTSREYATTNRFAEGDPMSDIVTRFGLRRQIVPLSLLL